MMTCRTTHAPRTIMRYHLLLSSVLFVGAVPQMLSAQVAPVASAEVLNAVRAGPVAVTTLEAWRQRCLALPLDGAFLAALRDAGASNSVIGPLGAMCVKPAVLEVRTPSPAAPVFLERDSIGVTPVSVTVESGKTWQITVGEGALRRTTSVTPAAATRVTLTVPLVARDSAAQGASAPRTAEDWVRHLGLESRYPSPGPEPTVPEAPGPFSRSTSFAGHAVVFGVAAAALGTVACNLPSKTSGPGYLDGAFVPAGTAYRAGVSIPCAAGLAALAGVAGGMWRSGARQKAHVARVAAFEQARDTLARARDAWRTLVARRDSQLASDPDIRRAREAEVAAQQTSALASASDTLVRVATEPLADARADRVTAVVAAAAPGPMPAPAPAPPPASVMPVRPALPGVAVAGVPTDNAPTELLSGIPVASARRATGVAVVVGNRRYRNSLVPAVEYAANDADAVRQHLERTFGFEPENIIDLRDATLSDLNQVFGTRGVPKGQLSGFLPEDGSADLFIYYAGHGAPDAEGRAYLVPADANPNALELTGYPLDVLYENVAKLPFRSVTVALDACFSGTSDRGAVVRGTSALMGAKLSIRNPLLVRPNAVIFSASAPDRVAYWNDDKRHSAFTYQLLTQLREAAVAPADSAALTARNIGAAIESAVSRHVRRTRPGNDQRPQTAGSGVDAPLPFLLRRP